MIRFTASFLALAITVIVCGCQMNPSKPKGSSLDADVQMPASTPAQTCNSTEPCIEILDPELLALAESVEEFEQFVENTDHSVETSVFNEDEVEAIHGRVVLEVLKEKEATTIVYNNGDIDIEFHMDELVEIDVESDLATL